MKRTLKKEEKLKLFQEELIAARIRKEELEIIACKFSFIDEKGKLAEKKGKIALMVE